MKSLVLCFILISGPLSVDDGQFKSITRIASYKLREAGVRLKVKSITRKNTKYTANWEVSKLGYQQLNAFHYYKSLYRRSANSRRFNRCGVHVVLPPMIVPTGERFLGGIASKNSSCNGSGFSVSNAVSDSISGESRIHKSGYVIAHELLHTLGAKHHNNPPNLMSEALPEGSPEVLTLTKKEICL